MNADTRTSTVVNRFLWVAAVLPAAFVAIGVGVQLAVLPRLPDPVAIHWGANGAPDGFGPGWVTIVLTALIGIGIPALMAGSTLPALRQGDHGPSYRFIGAMTPAVTGFLVVLLTWSQVMQAGLSDATAAPSIFLPLIVSLLFGVLVGLVSWFVQPQQAAAPQVGDTVEPLDVAAYERAAWMREVSMAPVAMALIVTSVLATWVAAVVAWFVSASAAVPWILVATAVLLTLALSTLDFRVRVNESGLSVTSVLGYPRFNVPLAEIASVCSVTVNPTGEFGGWGLRWVPGRFGVVMRAGEAIEVERKSGRAFVVTVDDSRTAVALLKGLVGRESGAQPTKEV